ncbi:hypothetical protein ACFLVB_05670 [Chloroflexota bacterium]
MTEKRIVTEINVNIVNHLFVLSPCPKCQKRHPLMLGKMYRQEKVVCPDCNTRMQFALGGHNQTLIDFAKSFDSLHAQLRKIGLPLAFFHDLTETIWERSDKP